MNYQKRFYVVWKGRQPGVYDDFNDAMAQVDDYPGLFSKVMVPQPRQPRLSVKGNDAKTEPNFPVFSSEQASITSPKPGSPTISSFRKSTSTDGP